MLFPSGEKARSDTDELSFMLPMTFQFDTDHNLILPSDPPLAKVWLSGEKAMAPIQLHRLPAE